MADRPRISTAVLISGSGTNLQALIDAATAPDYPARIDVVISNRPGVKGLARAQAAGIEHLVIDHKGFADRADFDAAIDQALRDRGIRIVCLAGFMRLLTADFVRSWDGCMVNIHPSLLPAFPGLDVQRRAIEAGAKVSGCTVHLVVPEMDAGPILVQAAVPIRDDDTPETLAARIQVQEHRAYPLALKLLAEGRVRVEGGRARLTSADDGNGTTAILSPQG